LIVILLEEFYNLSGSPFLLTPDSRFFFGSSGHSSAMAHLAHGLSQQEGFIVITGEVGAGKTMLVEQLWARLDRNTYFMARVATTQVSGDDLLRLAMASFGLGDTPGTEKSTLLRRFEHIVHDQRKQGRRCLLVIDEVQNLSLAGMEELRMLSNIVAEGKAAVQTLLFGQPQFRAILASKDWEQLRQRVLASCHLGPMRIEETHQYVQHRLRTVGWRDDPVWEEAAYSAVHRHAGGIPRRINTLCSRVMLSGALEETHTITGGMVDEVAEELSRDLDAGLESAGQMILAADGRRDLLRRIEMLERRAFRQEQVFQRVLDLLETNVTGQA
jgi:putative secretion ATPase (PEP-CTERM system associated)